jgi:hypothetical protein
MARKKKCNLCFFLPTWKNPKSGKAVYLYTAGLLYQFLALGLPYWNVGMLMEKGKPDAQLTVLGWTDTEATYPADDPEGKKICCGEDSWQFYQDEGAMGFIVFCVFWAIIINIICLLVAAKGAVGPAKSDKKIMPKVATLGFFGWLFGIVSMALFAPGDVGDVVNETTGFFSQLIGLTLMLGGVIVQFDSGENTSVDRQFRAMTAVNPA